MTCDSTKKLQISLNNKVGFYQLRKCYSLPNVHDKKSNISFQILFNAQVESADVEETGHQ